MSPRLFWGAKLSPARVAGVSHVLSQLQAQSLKAEHDFFSSEWAVFAYSHAAVEGSSPQQGPSSPWHPMGLSSQPPPDSCPGREWQDLRCTPPTRGTLCNRMPPPCSQSQVLVGRAGSWPPWGPKPAGSANPPKVGVGAP